MTDEAAKILADALHDIAAALRGLPWIKAPSWTPCPPYVPLVTPEPNTTPLQPNTWPYRPYVGDPIPGTTGPSITCSAVNQADGEGLSHTD